MTEKIFSAKQNESIKESLTQTLTILNIRRENRAIVLKPEQEMVIYSLLHRRDVMAILSTGFGKSILFIVIAMTKEDNVLIDNLYDHNFASKKVYIYIGDQISEMLLLSCTALELTTETVNLL